MSIYGTVFEMQIRLSGDDEWREVWGQLVPGHIDYTGEIWDFLPPPTGDDDKPRALFVCDELTRKGTSRNGQEYIDPVLVITGDDYQRATFDDLFWRIQEAMDNRWGKR